MAPHHYAMQAPGQSSSFHDQQTQPQMPNFPNMSLQNQQMQFRPGLSPFQGTPQSLRQFDMGMPQNHQSQNPSVALPQRMAPQQPQPGLSAHTLQSGTFQPSDNSHPAPHLSQQVNGNPQTPHSPQGLQTGQRNQADIEKRIKQYEFSIANDENSLNSLRSNRGGLSEVEVAHKMQQLTAELKNKRDMYHKLQALRPQRQGGLGNL
jgi:hypothetical protein